MTVIKLYEKQSFLKETVSTITGTCEEKGEYWVELEQTIFFPEEGGQYADTGVLIIEKLPEGYCGDLKPGDEIRLVDGQIKDEADYVTDRAESETDYGKIILYKILRFIPKGTVVREKLDWALRFSRMQNHSGEHILTGCIHRKYGLNNVGFHLSDDGFVTLDMDGVLSYEQVIELEKEANEIVYKDVPIIDSYPSKQELSVITYRSKIEIEGQTRLITIGDAEAVYDVCACCAPHVATTGQVGIIKVISVINYKKGIQIAILCGERALDYINNEHSIVTAVSRFLSTSPDNLEKVVKSRTEEIAELKAKLAKAVESKLFENIKSIPEGSPRCLFTDEELTAANMKNVYNALCDGYNGYVGIFAGSDESGYRYNAGSSVLDSRILANAMREGLGAKGGGSAEMSQGKVMSTRSEILGFFAKLQV